MYLKALAAFILNLYRPYTDMPKCEFLSFVGKCLISEYF